jgi:hypothetical protein
MPGAATRGKTAAFRAFDLRVPSDSFWLFARPTTPVHHRRVLSESSGSCTYFCWVLAASASVSAPRAVMMSSYRAAFATSPSLARPLGPCRGPPGDLVQSGEPRAAASARSVTRSPIEARGDRFGRRASSSSANQVLGHCIIL